AVDDHGRGRVAAQQTVLRQRREPTGGRITAGWSPRDRRGRRLHDGEQNFVVAHGPDPTIDAPPLRHRLEEILLRSDALRAAEKEIAAFDERETQQGDDSLLN